MRNESTFESPSNYPPRMTEKEFADRQNELLKRVPIEFHSALAYMAWEQGHSSGYEEVIGDLRDLVDGLEEPIKKYSERLTMRKT